jgi:ABC-type amino acid transport substrate-binding protein
MAILKVCDFGLRIMMKYFFCFWFVILSLSQARAEDSSSVKPLSMLVLKNAPPTSYRNENGDLVGFNVELGRLLCNIIKTPCDIKETLQANVIDMIAAGEVDIGMVSLIITPERSQKVLFTEPYRMSKTFWISKVPISQSQKIKVAVVDGSIQHKWASRKMAENQWFLIKVKTNHELGDVLRNGLAEAVISPSSTSLEIMKTKDLSQAGLNARAIESDEFNNPVGIAINPGKKELRDKINDALRQVKSNGELDKLNTKYYPFRVF